MEVRPEAPVEARPEAPVEAAGEVDLWNLSERRMLGAVDVPFRFHESYTVAA